MTVGQLATRVAALMNDTTRAQYTLAVVLPYFNIAAGELQELYELNNVPITNTTSVSLAVDSGIDEISFSTVPALPSDLVEIEQMWESPSGLNQWIPMVRRDFLPHYWEDDMPINQLLAFTFNNQGVQFVPANADNDIKLDYIKSLFPVYDDTDEDTEIGVINADTFLSYRTAGLCAQFIGEDNPRAESLNTMSILGMDRTLGISSKGRQSIVTRRRPFRMAYKSRGYS